MLARIISGGQTGVDRGSLDACLQLGFPCGGYCPAGRIAEDGTIPAEYPLTELAEGGYRQRMIQNLISADGTLLIYFGRLTGGTEQTLLQCIKKQRPYQLIDADEVAVPRAATLVARFIEAFHIRTLNVAGPRLSTTPRAADYTREVIARVLQSSPVEVAAAGSQIDVGDMS